MKKISLLVLTLLGASLLAYQNAWTGKLSGKVLDLKGNPIEGATIQINYESGEDYNKTLITKKNGSFALLRMPSGTVILSVTKAGYQPSTRKYEQLQDWKELNIYLVREGENVDQLGSQPKVSGTIFDSKGTPLAGVTVSMTTEALPGLTREAVTDENGVFEMETLADAVILLRATKEGYRDQLFTYGQTTDDYKIVDQDYRLLTIAEGYAEMGLEMPVEKELTPEEKAVELFNEAVDPYRNGEFAKAEELALMAHQQDPKQVQALRLLIFSNRQLQDWKDVLDYSEKFLKLNPDEEKITEMAMEAALFAKDKKAEAMYRKKIKEIKGVTPESLFSEAVAAINMNDDDTAKARLEECIKMNPKHFLAYFELGKIKVREGEFEEAIKQLKSFLKYAPENDKHRSEVTDLIVTLSE